MTFHAGYRLWTGYVLNQTQADALNRAYDRAERNPSEANKNGAHNLLNSYSMLALEEASELPSKEEVPDCVWRNAEYPFCDTY